MSGYGYVPIRFPGESNLNKGSYQDFGDLWLDYSAMGITEHNVTDYRRELDLQTAVAKTEFTYQNVVYTREHFVSSPDQVMVTRLTASEAGKLDVKIQMELNNSGLAGTTSLDTKENTCTIDGYVKDNGLKFRTTMKILPAGGTITANTGNQTYTVSGADSILIVMAAETNYKNDYPIYRDTEKNLATVVDERIKAAAEKSYEALKDAHLEDHQELFDRVSLDLGEVEAEIPTNELMDQYRQGDYSKYLEILSFQFGRYLTIAGSRGTLPSNLVGLWTVGDSA
jgi:alpha-L-fucosidase 2